MKYVSIPMEPIMSSQFNYTKRHTHEGMLISFLVDFSKGNNNKLIYNMKAAKLDYHSTYTSTHRAHWIIWTAVWSNIGTWTLLRVFLMCCGSAGWSGTARTFSALSSQPSIEPMSSWRLAAAVCASADLHISKEATTQQKKGQTHPGDRHVLVEQSLKSL